MHGSQLTSGRLNVIPGNYHSICTHTYTYLSRDTCMHALSYASPSYAGVRTRNILMQRQLDARKRVRVDSVAQKTSVVYYVISVRDTCVCVCVCVCIVLTCCMQLSLFAIPTCLLSVFCLQQIVVLSARVVVRIHLF
jgi:hypothetical protein